jgi:uroporphyrinogen decarboxylase
MAPMNTGSTDTVVVPPLLAASRRMPVPHTPVWFMRQAGRSLPEYRALRAGTRMLEACRDPALVCEVTMQPVRRHGVDAAVLFSDIMVPLAAAGIDLDIKPGIGPVVGAPVRTDDDVAAIRPLAADDLTFVDEAVRLLVPELGPVPLIGFAGAPFTLASYLVEGGPSREYTHTKALMHGDPQLWHALCAKLAQITLAFLTVQVAAGARVVQLFDSWAGALSEVDYRTYVAPHSTAVLSGLAAAYPDVPRIHFGVGTGELLPAMAGTGATVMGVDWRTPLDVASRRIGPAYAVQGNLDPATLFAPWSVVEEQVRRVLRAGTATPGHIFNLGHGVLPETDPDVLTRVVALVHEISASKDALLAPGV